MVRTMSSPRWIRRISDRRSAVKHLSDQQKKDAMRAMWTGRTVRDAETARLVVDECQDTAAKVPVWIWLILGVVGATFAAANGDWVFFGFFLIFGAGPSSYILWMRRRALVANLPIAEGSAES